MVQPVTKTKKHLSNLQRLFIDLFYKQVHLTKKKQHHKFSFVDVVILYQFHTIKDNCL